MMNKTALVTGGMGGIGESISRGLYDSGFDVIVTYSSRNVKFEEWQKEQLNDGYVLPVFRLM